jgi:carboxyl-terminal processing protease
MRNATSVLVIAAMLLSACGGGGGSGGSGGGTVVLPTPTPTPTATTCGLAQRQAFALSTLQEWYLFPTDLATNVNPASFTTVDDYIDALVAPARASGKDKFFTFITSIAEENAFFASGSSAGFGVRLAFDASARRVFIAEAFEGAPAFGAGIDRGDEITAIGDTATNLRNVTDIIAAEGTAGVTNALGPSTAGVTRTLRVVGPSGTRTLTVAKADFNLTPISSRYGARIITDGSKQIGYLNLRTFISSADQPLREAFLSFRNAGVTEFIIDVRYNGGGLVSTAELIGDLLGRDRSTNQIWSRTDFRASKSNNNDIDFFNPGPNSVAPVKIAFIGTGGTASASELIINSSIPYLGNNMALIGGNTFGKPVGQIAIDRAACDDRIRVVAFATGNSLGQSDYFNGLASKVPNTCRAADDISFPLGDPREASVRTAIDFLAGRSCTAISAAEKAGGTSQRTLVDQAPQLLAPDAPTPAQREVPGMF